MPRRGWWVVSAVVLVLLGWQGWQSAALQRAAAGLLSLCGSP